MRNILRYYPYKPQFVQELLQHDFETRHLLSLQFLARLEVDPEWPWNILRTDKAHFHLDGSVNTHNCRIWETDNPHSTLRVPLHSPKVTAWCGFSASFILGPYFFEKLGAGGPVTCSITGQRYASLLRNKIISDLQARQCLSRTIFMQDGAPPHIIRCVTDVLKHHFTEERVISHQFRHLWPPRTPDLNPCDFFALGPFKTAESVARVFAIVGDHRCLTPRHCFKETVDVFSGYHRPISFHTLPKLIWCGNWGCNLGQSLSNHGPHIFLSAKDPESELAREAIQSGE
ncbi:uncharacterized protein TNCV_2821371 [Trichonephila clavipes]|uniref:Transposase n=1 Tax=Trichonephila clavipes TaxID=2585209 RepID=A0A8X6WIF3_TRICX|nr:uncharacterized protein TNCV_2821371 [Trichonephila clavipes]